MTIPARSLAISKSTDGDVVATCDCGYSAVIEFVPYDPATGRAIEPGERGHVRDQEVAYECGGCGSVHWLRIMPDGGVLN